MAMMAPMARSTSALRQPSSGVLMKGIFLHPDHGLDFASPSAPSTPLQATTPTFSTAFVNPFKPEDTLAQMDDLSLSAPSSPVVSEPDSPVDYFSSRTFNWHRNSDSSLTSDSSMSSVDSSAVSTPTCESPYPKAQTLSRNNSSYGLFPESPACPSPQFPASFSFSTFAAPHSTPSSRPSSPPRGLPYARPIGSSMQRAVSSPVETQRALDLRTRAMSVASDAMTESAGRIARSKSVVGLPGLGFGGASMSRQKGSKNSLYGGCPSPLITPFEEGWGSALPAREYEAPAMIPFPYNVGVTPPSPHRVARSHSVSAAHYSENQAPIMPSGHRHSLPTSHLPAAPPCAGVSSPSSSSMGSRSRRGTLTLAPLTPILPSSPLMSVEESQDREAFATGVHSSPKRRTLKRGVTY